MIEPSATTERVTNAMTVDVEEHFQVSGFAGVVRPEDWGAYPSRVEANTDRVLDLLARNEVRATFFVLGWVADRHPALARRIADAGHEVGSHGWSHQLVYEQDPATFRDETVRSKKLLEDQSGTEVSSYRAASFSIGRANLWALDVLAEAGFAYDSSLFPVVHDRYGIPGAPRRPYRLRTPGGHGMVEVPPSTVSFGRFTLPVAGGGYLRLYPAPVTDWAVCRLNSRERLPANVYVHPWEFDPDQPRVAGVGWKSRFRHYVNLDTTEDKLDRLLKRYRFGTLREAAETAGPLDEVRLGTDA